MGKLYIIVLKNCQILAISVGGKNFRLLEYEHITYHFQTLDLEISNAWFVLQSIHVLRFNERFNEFHEIYYCS